MAQYWTGNGSPLKEEKVQSWTGEVTPPFHFIFLRICSLGHCLLGPKTTFATKGHKNVHFRCDLSPIETQSSVSPRLSIHNGDWTGGLVPGTVGMPNMGTGLDRQVAQTQGPVDWWTGLFLRTFPIPVSLA